MVVCVLLEHAVNSYVRVTSIGLALFVSPWTFPWSNSSIVRVNLYIWLPLLVYKCKILLNKHHLTKDRIVFRGLVRQLSDINCVKFFFNYLSALQQPCFIYVQKIPKWPFVNFLKVQQKQSVPKQSITGQECQWYHTTSRAPAKKIHLGLFCWKNSSLKR